MKNMLFVGAVVGLLSGCIGSDTEEMSSTDERAMGTVSTLEGDWRSPCVEVEGHGWAQMTMSFTGESTAEQTNRLFSSANCSGEALDEMVLDVRFDAGEAVELASGETAYRIEYKDRELRDAEALLPPFEDVYVVDGDRLYFGDPKESHAANKDVQSELNREFVYERL